MNESSTNSFTQVLEAESLIALGEPDEAIKILETTADLLPGDPVVAGWKDLVRTDTGTGSSSATGEVEFDRGASKS